MDATTPTSPDAKTAADIARHAWFDSYEPLCFTLIEGVAEDEVIRRFGGDPKTGEVHDPGHYWELMSGRDYDDLLHMVRVGTAATGQVFAIEINGWTGKYIHRGLTRDGARAFTIYTHINGADCTCYTVDGRPVIDEEPWGPLTPLSDPEPDPQWNPTWCDGLSDEDNDVFLRGANQMVLAERVMGIPIDPQWFEIPLRTVILPDIYENPAIDPGTF
jgi:hypothetical protein